MLRLVTPLVAASLACLVMACGPTVEGEEDDMPTMEAGNREFSLEVCEAVAAACANTNPSSYDEFQCIGSEIDTRVVLAEPRACDDAAGTLADVVLAAREDEPTDLAAACEQSTPGADDPLHDCLLRP